MSERFSSRCEQPAPKKKREKTFSSYVSPKQKEYYLDDDLPLESTGEGFEEELEATSLAARRKSEKRELLVSIFLHIFQVTIIIASVYITYLIYGVMVTSYGYDSNGQIVPNVLSVAQLQELSEYENLQSYYLRAQNLYKETLELDFKLSQNEDKALMVAMEYQELLSDVDKLVTDIAAEDADGKYSAIYNQLNTWVATDIAVYLQNIATAITDNSEDKANKALIARNVMYEDFAKITENMMTIAQNTKGVHIGDIYSWSPDDFISDMEANQ